MMGDAGGIGPDTIETVLKDIEQAGKGKQPVWIAMESRVRSEKDCKDVFDLDGCYQVVDAVCRAGYIVHPEYLE